MITYFAGVSSRFGFKPKEAERFIKFLVVGGIGFVVDFGIFNLLLNPANALVMPGTSFYNLLAISTAVLPVIIAMYSATSTSFRPSKLISVYCP